MITDDFRRVLAEVDEELITDDFRRVLAEVDEELKLADPVYQSINYRRFVSYSKGRRNGKKRIRKCWKEIHLVKYRGGGFSQWHRFPFDVYATEILGPQADGELLKEHIERLWGY